ncbi:MAG TPA: flagellar hook-basal body complex protein FliE [Clostridia bacterium]|nr:flagellar hook-basal body complex protein FliE [Clostridia bacterium]
MMGINSIKGFGNIELGSAYDSFEDLSEDTISFSTFLRESIEKVNSLEKDAKQYDFKIATGRLENIHEATIATQKADIALQLTMQIRNKILEAYREIMRMQI